MLVPLLLLSLAASPAGAQGTAPPQIARQSGTDPEQHIQYVLLSVSGKVATTSTTPTLPVPQLVAQCSLTPAGKFKFELLTNFGNSSTPLTFAAPWKPQPGELFPPHLVPVTVTMQFLGYTKVKPVRREWDTLLTPHGWLRYSTPGTRSRNMEEIMFYLQYLRALPTLRLSYSGSRTMEFETTAWQQAIHAEPLCHASGL